jgi:dihydropyrimidine dehydrogenase (NAD+) subunit PreT
MLTQQSTDTRMGRSPQGSIQERWRAMREAGRCLGCYDPPCVAACPTHINVSQFIGRIRTENMAGAYETLVSANVLPAICGLVCPTEYLCEGACVLTQLAGHPVRIGDLQYFVCQEAQTYEVCLDQELARVAVLGGGPAGIACAVALRRMGYRVSLYDQHEHLGGLVTYSIPNYRLPDAAVAAEIIRFEQAGIEMHLGVRMDADKLGDFIEEYDALFLGIGLSTGASLNIPGLELEGVWSALDYLDAVRRAGRGEDLSPDLKGRVIVIGGGNVALDVAGVVAVEGATEVLILYRRTVKEMPAWESEYRDATVLGVQFQWLTAVSEIQGEHSRVTGVLTHKMKLIGEDSAGRRAVQPIPGTEEVLPCDAVILAIGQALDFGGLEKLGIEVNPDGTLQVDPDTWQTTRPGVFAGGDAVRGSSYVVQAVADGMQAASAIGRYLAGECAS